jgi:hypothetical protein
MKNAFKALLIIALVIFVHATVWGADNRYEVVLLIKNAGKVRADGNAEDKLIIDAPDQAKAKTKAIDQAAAKWKRPVSDIQVIIVKELPAFRETPKTRGTVVESDSPKDVQEVAEDILEKLQVSNEFAGMIAEFKKLNKIASKLGGLGKALTFIDVSNDMIKLSNLYVQYSDANDKNAKKKIMVDIVLLTAKLTKTAITIASPAAGLVDLGFSVACMGYTAVQKASTEKQREKARAAREWMETISANYAKEKGALKPTDAGYYFELNLHASGVPMADILETRRDLTTVNFRRDGNRNFKNPYKQN